MNATVYKKNKIQFCEDAGFAVKKEFFKAADGISALDFAGF
jgi:hypothetical protein